MRPLSIEVQHFGTYVQHRIDLEVFGTEGLFLVHGDTGSGKSTILDAIAWALYGKGLGTRDRDEHLRSRNAPPDAATTVTLEFALGARRFRVRRSMGGERVSKRGGMTRLPADATLTCVTSDAGFEPVTTVTRCNAAIEELLGLPYEQFTRIIVLPQGEFRELLLARADDRERLLERLFGTALYTAIEEQLREAERAAERAHDESRARLDSVLQGAEVTELAALDALGNDVEASLAAAIAQHRDGEQRIAAIEAEVQQARAWAMRDAERAQLRAALQRLDDDTEAHARDAETLHAAVRAASCEALQLRASETRAQLDETTQLLAKASRARAEAAKVLDDPARSEGTLRALHDELAAAQERLGVLEAMERELDDVAAQSHALDAARVALSAAEQHVAALDGQRAMLEQLRSELLRKGEEARRAARGEAAALLRVEEVERRLAAAATRRSLNEQLREALRVLKTAERAAAQQRERFTEAQHEYERAVAHVRSATAARLAATLAPGVPCPVCGSVEHPSPALAGSLGNEAPFEGDLQRLEAVCERARDMSSDTERALARAQGEHDALARQFASQIADDDASEAELTAASEAARRSLEDVRRTRRVAEECDRTLESRAREFEQLSHDHIDAVKRVAEAQTRVTQLAARIEAGRARLAQEVGDASTLRGAVEMLRERVRHIADTLERTRRERAAAETAHARATAAYDHAERAHDDAEARAVAAAARFEAVLREARFESVAAYEAARRSHDERNALQQRVDEHRATRASVSARLLALGEDEGGHEGLAAREALLAAERITLADAQRSVGSLRERATQLRAALTRAAAHATALEDAARRWAVTRRVSDLANGRHGGRTRLSRYVLLEQFDRVVACASARLDGMSDGRFRMRRRATRQTGGEFELVVDDAYAGSTERPVATLSGGEMFLASLAMALGLSDVVEACSGGIRIESLFVDEGFGTLDEEALDKAVSVLEQLGEHHRLVGVVSHVAELRKRIPARLEVLRGERGSWTRASVRARARS